MLEKTTLKTGKALKTTVATLGIAGTGTLVSAGGGIVHADEVTNPTTHQVENTSAQVKTTTSNTSQKAKTYTVKSGDTLYNIAQRTGVSLQKIFNYNNLNVNSIIHPGDVIKLDGNVKQDESTREDLVKVNQTITKETIDSHGNRKVTKEVKTKYVPRSEANKTFTNTSYTREKAPSQGNVQQGTQAQGTQASQGQTQTAQTGTSQKTYSSKAQAIVARAKELAGMGIPYVWGGTSLSGMDCSGLVKIVLGEQGINIGRVTTQQERNVVTKPVSQAQPGDLLFWGPRGSTHHVAIYIGNNQYVEAPQPGQNVHINTINSYYMPSFAGSVRGVNA